MQNSIIQDLIVIASKEFGVNILEERRTTAHVYGRFIVYYLLRKHLGYTYWKIANVFNLTHASVLHGIKELPFIIKFDDTVAQNLINISSLWQESSNKNDIIIHGKGIKYLENKINLLNLEVEVCKTQLNKLKKLQRDS